MTNQAKPKPIREIQRHLVKAAIWEHPGDKGARYAVKLSKLYKDKNTNKWVSTDYFDPTDLLTLAQVAELAWHEYHQLRGEQPEDSQAAGEE